jgi:hypothetical protein
MIVEECAHIQIITNQAKHAFGSPNVYAASVGFNVSFPLTSCLGFLEI